MGWEDRDYHREKRGGSGRGGEGVDGIFRALNWSFPIGTYLGIRVRVHITFTLLILIDTLQSSDKLHTLRWIALLFVSVLLHEFGHCLACRKVGGSAKDILMWPLGGLAFVSPPQRPWPAFVTTAWGPLVTAILAAISYLGLSLRYGFENLVSVNPLQMLAPNWDLLALRFSTPITTLDWLLVDLFIVNYALLLFNLLLVFYPFDGGRMIQEIAWARMGYERSMLWASRIGMVGAIVVAGYGIYTSSFMILFIAVFGFVACLQQLQIIRQAGDVSAFEAAYRSQNLSSHRSPASVRRGMLFKWRSQRAQRRARADAHEDTMLQNEVDRILDKVRQHGLHSLSRGEKKALQRATDRQRRVG